MSALTRANGRCAHAQLAKVEPLERALAELRVDAWINGAWGAHSHTRACMRLRILRSPLTRAPCSARVAWRAGRRRDQGADRATLPLFEAAPPGSTLVKARTCAHIRIRTQMHKRAHMRLGICIQPAQFSLPLAPALAPGLFSGEPSCALDVFGLFRLPGAPRRPLAPPSRGGVPFAGGRALHAARGAREVVSVRRRAQRALPGAC
jgi:hypothetical protein